MAMGYMETPQSLADIYNGPVGAFIPSMQALGRQQGRDALTQQDQERQLSFNTQADPHRLERMNLENQTTDAHLPGIRAQGSLQQIAAKRAAALSDKDIQDMIGQYDSKELSRHVDDVDKLGTFFAQHGARAFSHPMGAAQRVKAELTKMGRGDLWNDSWEEGSDKPEFAGVLARRLTDYGTDLTETGTKYRQALELAARKGDSAVEVAKINAQAKGVTDALRLQGIRETIAAKSQLGKNPKNWEQWGAQMAEFARSATNPDEKAALEAEAAKAVEVSKQLRSAAAGVTAATKPDTGEMGVPTVGDTTPPPANPFSPKAAAPLAVPPGMPPGTVANPDGTLTLPDGTRIRKKQ
jgi:hypothetical protein